jgi:nucleotide-binding universal stress UspA family protein
MFKHIMIPTDGSPQSQKAAARGVELAKAVGAKVTAFFAAPPATPVIYRDQLPVGFAQPAEHDEIIKKTAAKHLGFIERVARKAGVRCEGVHVTSDYPAEAILDMVKKKKCDLVVMSTHSKGGLRDMFVGSVTQKVLNQSKVPVMVFQRTGE